MYLIAGYCFLTDKDGGKPHARNLNYVHSLKYLTESTQKMVRANLSRKHRSLIAKLKCGVLPLALETGRFKNVPRVLRTCKVCDKNLFENEYHHLLHCEKLSYVRDLFKQDMLDIVKHV